MRRQVRLHKCFEHTRKNRAAVAAIQRVQSQATHCPVQRRQLKWDCHLEKKASGDYELWEEAVARTHTPMKTLPYLHVAGGHRLQHHQRGLLTYYASDVRSNQHHRSRSPARILKEPRSARNVTAFMIPRWHRRKILTVRTLAGKALKRRVCIVVTAMSYHVTQETFGFL